MVLHNAKLQHKFTHLLVSFYLYSGVYVLLSDVRVITVNYSTQWCVVLLLNTDYTVYLLTKTIFPWSYLSCCMLCNQVHCRFPVMCYCVQYTLVAILHYCLYTYRLADLTQIEELVLSGNDFTDVPEVITTMTSLKRLNMGSNKLLTNLSEGWVVNSSIQYTNNFHYIVIGGAE